MSVKDNYSRAYGISSHAEGSYSYACGNASHAEGLKLFSSRNNRDATEQLNDFSNALNKISRAAQSCGVSMQAMVAATNAFAQQGMDLSTSAEAALREVNNKPKEESYLETVKECARQVENKQHDFDIPRFDLSAYRVETDESLFNFKPFEPMQVLQRMEEKRPVPNLAPVTKGVVIKLRRDTEENCAKSNLLLHEGEICLVQKSDGNYYAVVGDGESRILDCPHLTFY